MLAIIEQDGKRVLTTMRWGFTSVWWKGSRPPPINARAETITERPTFHGSYKHKRCLIPADGFYEWVTRPGRKKKQPMHLHLPDDAPFAFAGIWTPDADGELTCAIVTTAANEVVQSCNSASEFLNGMGFSSTNLASSVAVLIVDPIFIQQRPKTYNVHEILHYGQPAPKSVTLRKCRKASSSAQDYHMWPLNAHIGNLICN